MFVPLHWSRDHGVSFTKSRMSKIKFTIGKSNGVTFNLPSRKRGDADTCMGKVLVNVPGLNCANDLSFSKMKLAEFRNEIEEIHRSLYGQANISSKCGSFRLVVTITEKGHVKVVIEFSKFKFDSPDNAEWKTEICFYDYLDSLIQIIKSKDEIQS